MFLKMLMSCALISSTAVAGGQETLAPSLAATTTVATMQKGAAAESESRMFDLRGLALLLPEREPEAAPASSGPFGAQKAPERPDVMEELLIQISEAAGVSIDAVLIDHIVIATGSGEELDNFETYLSRIEALYGQRFELDLFCYEVEATDAPDIGDRADGDEVMHRVRQIVIGGRSTKVESLTKHAYVSDLTPVVGTQALGADPQVSSVSEGLAATATIMRAVSGPGAELSLDLTLTWVEFDEHEVGGDAFEGPKGQGRLSLPRTTVRRIEASIEMTGGDAVVIAVTDSVDEGSSIVVAASVRSLK